MTLRNWMMIGAAAALLSACNSNDTQRTTPRSGATTAPASEPQGRSAGPVMARSRDGGVGPGISSGASKGSETTSGTSSGLNATPNAPASGTTTPTNTGANGSSTDSTPKR